MKVAVWDTYVQRSDGKIMHFDILVPEYIKDTVVIYQFGQDYLKNKHMNSEILTVKECKLCHIEEATNEIIRNIEVRGYHIVEIKNCN